MAGHVMIAAGGTGGHLFPAEALAAELTGRGYAVDLVTDHRATLYGQDFPARKTHIVASATLTSKSPLGLASFGWALVKGLVQSLAIVRQVKPVAVIGFGGYPTVPPLLAGWLLKRPVLVHESNAVMGRANRFLAAKMTAIATTFPKTKLLGAAEDRAVMTGNPVRPKVIAAAAKPYALPQDGGRFNLLVFGGSQGARVFADLMPDVLKALPQDVRDRLKLTQQVRAEDHERVTSVYDQLGLSYEAAPFFTDLPGRIADAHLVIGRSGASTVAELTVIGRPSVLVPLPHALDNDQKTNALQLQAAGAAIMAEQASLTPQLLANHLKDLIGQPERLSAMAESAKTLGRPDAVVRLADLVVAVARR